MKTFTAKKMFCTVGEHQFRLYCIHCWIYASPQVAISPGPLPILTRLQFDAVKHDLIPFQRSYSSHHIGTFRFLSHHSFLVASERNSKHCSLHGFLLDFLTDNTNISKTFLLRLLFILLLKVYRSLPNVSQSSRILLPISAVRLSRPRLMFYQDGICTSLRFQLFRLIS